MSLPAHNSSYDDSSDYVPKATPVAPAVDSRMDAKPARKAEGAFRTISEVADELDVPQHVLRFWETKFSQVRPLKRGGGRRYYRPEDVSLLKHIHYLLYTEGYTIKGVQKLLKGQGKNQIAAKGEQTQAYVQEKLADPYREHANAAGSDGYEDDASTAPAEAAVYSLSNSQRNALEEMLGELKAMRALIPQAA